jgi:hypothetical protein
MSLYVPGSNHGYDVIEWFASGYRIYLDDARKNIHIWAAPRGDQSQPISDNLIFTNRIYIYHENIFEDGQINQLTNIYRSKGLEPIFRGFGGGRDRYNASYVRVQFHVYNDIHARVRFMAFYIPYSIATLTI